MRELENLLDRESEKKKRLSKEQVQKDMYLHVQNVELNVKKKSEIMECYQDEDVAFFMFGFNM